MLNKTIGVAIGWVFALPLLTTCAASPQLQVSDARPERPNIIFILTDDQRYDDLGILNEILETPYLDGLADNGVHFRNAFVTTALCSPSRATILTGQYMNRHGIVDNNQPFPENTEFFSSYLQDAGYNTAFIGKWHMGGDSDEPQPGFDQWVSFAGQGQYYPVNKNGRQSFLNVNGQSVPQDGYITDELTDYAIEWLSNRKEEEPFFLYLSHKAVHSDFLPAGRHQHQYNDEIITSPANEDRLYEEKPIWVRNQRNSWHGIDYPYHSDLDITEYQRRYYQTLSAVDDSLGRVLNWLKDNDLEENTIVIFMSDNGFLFGEHGLIDKRNAYEESMRVPLLIAGPGLSRGVSRDEMVANLDIAPTILDFAGLVAPGHFQGRSFRRLAEGPNESEEWRSELVYEYFWEYTYPQTPTTFAIRTDEFKYIQYHGVWDIEELYNIQTDPTESINLIHDPAYADIVVTLKDQLFKQLQDEHGDNVVPYNQRVRRPSTRRSESGADAADFPPNWIDP